MGVREFQAPEAAASAVPRPTLATALVDGLLQLGVRQAFGVSGGAMATLWHAMSASRLQVCHFRHESGAAFAAAEAHFVSGRPVLVFTTTGPGLSNALTGLLAARGEGAKVILLSACSSAASRGRFAIQETSPQTMPEGLYASGPLFRFARTLEDPDELPELMHQLAPGLARRGGFIAHVAVPTAVQAMPMAEAASFASLSLGEAPGEPTPAALNACLRALADEPFAIWLGFGARGAAGEVRALAERTGAAVFCTPRGKGILPETHPLFIGVTGMGGHESVAAWVATHGPSRILVLGSRLGEASSLYDPRFVPRRGFVHVDVDPAVAEVAYPEAPTLPIVADVGALLRGVLAMLPAKVHAPTWPCSPPTVATTTLARSDRVRPEVLMDVIQRQVVDATEATLLAESGHAFIWATHRLRFATPGRYRVSTGFGAMGHATTGVVGAALASTKTGRGCRAVALVGDGSMLMHNEINTAVKYAAPAVWIVLNDGRYGMCCQGMETLGLRADALFPAVDFVAMARAQGGDGVRVQHEHELDGALWQAMHANGPFVVDVLIDELARAPSGARNRGLARQLAHTTDVSFPSR